MQALVSPELGWFMDRRRQFCVWKAADFLLGGRSSFGPYHVDDDWVCHLQLHSSATPHWLQWVSLLYMHPASCGDCKVPDCLLRGLHFPNTHALGAGGAARKAAVYAQVSPQPGARLWSNKGGSLLSRSVFRNRLEHSSFSHLSPGWSGLGQGQSSVCPEVIARKCQHFHCPAVPFHGHHMFHAEHP